LLISEWANVWLAKFVAGMISSQHEAPVFASGIDARARDGRAHCYQLFNAPNTDF
jgi:hypothetical protein